MYSSFLFPHYVHASISGSHVIIAIIVIIIAIIAIIIIIILGSFHCAGILLSCFVEASVELIVKKMYALDYSLTCSPRLEPV